MVIYFVSFMICGALFVMNMFVGVVIDNFNKEKDQQELAEDTDVQSDLKTSLIYKQMMTKKKEIYKQSIRPDGFRGKVHDFVHHPKFDKFIVGIVILNTLALSVKSYQMSNDVHEVIEFLNYLFALIFNIEMIVKLISDGYSYFFNMWNLFDMFIVITADIGIVLDLMST